MDIIVCIKQVPGTTEVEIDEKTGVLKRSGIESKMNPYDLYALETALKIKEKYNGKIKVLSMGPPQAKSVIKEAYMMGADEGYLLSDMKFAGADCLATSYTLAQGIGKMGNFDLIICGKQTTDGDTAQVGPELAEQLDISHTANVRKILEVNHNEITVEIDMQDFIQVAKIKLPCLITVEKNIYQPRLPSYKKKIATRGRKISLLSSETFESKAIPRFGLDGSPTKVERVFPPETKKFKETWAGDGKELSERLTKKLAELKFI